MCSLFINCRIELWYLLHSASLLWHLVSSFWHASKMSRKNGVNGNWAGSWAGLDVGRSAEISRSARKSKN